MRLYTDSGVRHALRPPTGLPYAQRRIRRGISGIGQTLLERPGPGDVGIEIVDPSGNIVYSADQVAANPSLLNQLNSSNQCPPPMVPTWYPGGQSECAMPGAQGGTYIQGAPVGQCDDPSGLCYGSTWNGQPITTPGQIEQIPVTLPVIYNTPVTNGGGGGAPVSTPVPTQNITPPAAGSPVTVQPPASGIAPGTVINGTPTGTPAAATCGGIGWGPCVGPLDAGTWGLIAAGVVLFLMIGKK